MGCAANTTQCGYIPVMRDNQVAYIPASGECKALSHSKSAESH